MRFLLQLAQDKRNRRVRSYSRADRFAGFQNGPCTCPACRIPDFILGKDDTVVWQAP